MTLDGFRIASLALPGATERVQWGHDAVFKIGGKMFALASLDPVEGMRAAFKCSPERFAELCEQEGIIPAPYLARARWVALERWDALPTREVRELVDDSYALVMAGLPRKIQATLGAAATPPDVGKRPRRPRRTRRT